VSHSYQTSITWLSRIWCLCMTTWSRGSHHFHPSNTSSIIFHFKPSVLFSDILCKYGILVNLAKLVITRCRAFSGGKLCINLWGTWWGNHIPLGWGVYVLEGEATVFGVPKVQHSFNGWIMGRHLHDFYQSPIFL